MTNKWSKFSCHGIRLNWRELFQGFKEQSLFSVQGTNFQGWFLGGSCLWGYMNMYRIVVSCTYTSTFKSGFRWFGCLPSFFLGFKDGIPSCDTFPVTPIAPEHQVSSVTPTGTHVLEIEVHFFTVIWKEDWRLYWMYRLYCCISIVVTLLQLV